jgi:CRP-like cAMP-binding protein
MISLKSNLESLVGKNPPFLTEVLSSFIPETLAKSEYVLRETQVCNHIFYLEVGLIQVFQTNQLGQENTIDLLLPGEWFTDLPSFKQQAPSSLFAKCLKPCKLQKIGKDSFDKLMKLAPKFTEGYQLVIEQKYLNMQSRLQALHSLKSTERIQWLWQQKPDLFNACPDKILASYLGIAKETFCRQKMMLT